MDGSVAILTPHTAFIDPTTPKDAPLRESIELRALVLYVISHFFVSLSLANKHHGSYDNLPNGN